MSVPTANHCLQGVYDTCGIHNLHGMPGVLAGIAGSIAAATATEVYTYHNSDILHVDTHTIYVFGQADYKSLAALQSAFPGRYNEDGSEVCV